MKPTDCGHLWCSIHCLGHPTDVVATLVQELGELAAAYAELQAPLEQPTSPSSIKASAMREQVYPKKPAFKKVA